MTVRFLQGIVFSQSDTQRCSKNNRKRVSCFNGTDIQTNHGLQQQVYSLWFTRVYVVVLNRVSEIRHSYMPIQLLASVVIDRIERRRDVRRLPT